MMSLVAYDSSDESEEEKSTKKIITKEKKKEAVKIRIPSLKEFEDEEETPVAKKPKLQSGSKLSSLLPPPKNTSTLSKPGFVPHILSSKKEQPPSTSNESKSTKINSAPTVSSEFDDEISFAKDMSSEENENAFTHNDFFWLDDLASKEKPDESEKSVMSSESGSLLSNLLSASNNNMQQFNQTESKEVAYFQHYYHQQPTVTNTFHAKETFELCQSSVEQSYANENSVTESVKEMDTKELLNDKEFLKLQGRRKEFENVDIIDVNADDQLTDKNEWLMKNLTQESTHRPSRKKHNMPTQQQKRKHQITYLAFQAKERENDLKNQWASNSRTRRETQAKYGF